MAFKAGHDIHRLLLIHNFFSLRAQSKHRVFAKIVIMREVVFHAYLILSFHELFFEIFMVDFWVLQKINRFHKKPLQVNTCVLRVSFQKRGTCIINPFRGNG